MVAATAQTDNARRLPQGWAESRIGDVVEGRIKQGLPEDKQAFTYVDISAVDNGLKEIVEPKILSTTKAPSRARQQLKCGDILVSTTRPNLNAVALVPPQLDSAIASTGFAVLRPILLEPRWLYSVVQSEDFVAEMSALVKGALYPTIRPSHVHNYVMPVPPLAEQKRIINKLTKLLKRLRNVSTILKALPELIQQYRAAVLEAACSGRLVPTEAELTRKEGRDFEPASVLLERILVERRALWEADQLTKMKQVGKEPQSNKWKDRYKEPKCPEHHFSSLMPGGWCSASVGQCGFVQLGRQRSPEKRSKNFPRPYIRAANITESGIDVTNILEMDFLPNEFERFRLQVGDILISEASGSPEQVGKPAVWNGEIKDCCFQNTVIRLKPITLSSEFLLLVFKFFYTSGAFTRAASGVGINHLGAGKFSRMVIPLPPLAEQYRIVAEVERQFSAITAIESQIEVARERTKSLRLGLFHHAFSGRLVAQSSKDAPAAQLLETIATTRQSRQNNLKKEAKKLMKKKSHIPSEKRGLLGILGESPDGLTPDQLMAAAGYTSEEVPAFYKALRNVEKDIQEIRPERKVVILKRRKS